MRRGLLAGALGVVALALGCGRGACAPPEGPRARVQGRVVGTVSRVILLNAGRDVSLATTPATDGTYAIDCSREDLLGARVVVEGPKGATTTSGKLALAAAATGVSVAPLSLWRAPVDVKREGNRLRFSWPALQDGASTRLRYSLILAYQALRNGERTPVDATLVTKDPEALQTLDEIAEILPDRDRSVPTILVRARAYDAADSNGPTWAGEPLDWTVPDDLPVRAGTGQ